MLRLLDVQPARNGPHNSVIRLLSKPNTRDRIQLFISVYEATLITGPDRHLCPL